MAQKWENFPSFLKRKCIQEALKILENMRPLVLVPVPVFVHLRHLHRWGLTTLRWTGWSSTPSSSNTDLWPQPEQYVVCTCWLKIVWFRTLGLLSYWASSEPLAVNVTCLTFWESSALFKGQPTRSGATGPSTGTGGQAKQGHGFPYNVEDSSTCNAISYQCVKQTRHQISHHRGRKSDRDRDVRRVQPSSHLANAH